MPRFLPKPLSLYHPLRKLGNTDLKLQHNKVINLKLAVQSMDGVLIAPGQYFLFVVCWENRLKSGGMLKGWSYLLDRLELALEEESAS